jgi:hypothetical protein
MIKKINSKWEYTVDRFIDELAKPTFILRMSKPFEHENSSRGKACRKKCLEARKDIECIIGQLVWKNRND